MRVDLTIDHWVRTDWNRLPEELKRDLLEALSVPNQAKIKGMKAGQWSARDLPDTIPMYRFERGEFCLPRGFLPDLQSGLLDLGHTYRIDDRRTYEELYRIGQIIDLEEHQAKALPDLVAAEHGIWKAPAGSGKTVGLLGLIRKMACRSVVVVNTKDVMWQWVERAQQYLGPHYPVGMVGAGKNEVSPYLTIAMAQTLVSRFDRLEEEGFFDLFGLAYMDECHWATAETYMKLMNRFSARLRGGVSATPEKTGDFELAQLVLGPIVHETNPKDVKRLMKPKLIKVPTKFGFGYQGATSRWSRSNYPELVDALIDDVDRNQLIAHTVRKFGAGHHSLLFSARVRHLEILRAYIEDLDYPDPIMVMTGKTPDEDRKRFKKFMETEKGLLLSTVANEAVDIARLDRGFMPFPQGNTGLITQQVGRFERKHPDKADALIFDFSDGNVGPTDRQWKKRRTEVYIPRGYEVTLMRADDILPQPEAAAA